MQKYHDNELFIILIEKHQSEKYNGLFSAYISSWCLLAVKYFLAVASE